jgi:hypothetical protein
LSFWPQIPPIAWPISDDPVNEMSRTPGWLTSGIPTSRPLP